MSAPVPIFVFFFFLISYILNGIGMIKKSIGLSNGLNVIGDNLNEDLRRILIFNKKFKDINLIYISID